MPDVEIRDNGEASRFEAIVHGEVVGFAEYRLKPGVITFTHTEVDDDQEGQGIGSALVRESLDGVRTDGELKVRIACPFYRAYLERHHDWDDLLLT
jgi:predicted GNAT family acetyltransferase